MVLATSVKATEPIEWWDLLGGEGKLIIMSQPSQIGFVQENVVMCFYFFINADGDLLGGLMNIPTVSLGSLGNLTMFFTGSILGKDNPNMRITFFPSLIDPETQLPILGEEPIAFAVGFFDKKNMKMKFVIQSPNLGITQGYGAFTGNFELTKAGAGTFCSGF